MPRSLGELAERLQRPGSVSAALHRVPLPGVQTAEALAALAGPVGADGLAVFLGVPLPDLEETLRVLAEHALVWPDGQGRLHMAAALRRMWPTPLGLGPGLEQLAGAKTSEELRTVLAVLGVGQPRSKAERLAAVVAHHSDPVKVRALADGAPAHVKTILEQHAGLEADDTKAGSARPPGRGQAVQWALERALLVRVPYGQEAPRMPAEVALALRGPDWCPSFTPKAPLPELVAVTAEEVEQEAAAAVTAFAGRAAAVLAECARRPPAQLKAGGLGARELARLAKATRTGEQTVRLVLEIAHTAGLLARSGDQVLASPAYDAWTEQEPAGQLVLLLRAWRRHEGTPSQFRDRDGKALPALDNPPCTGCRDARHSLLTAASQLPDGHGVRRTSELGPAVAWHRPLADRLPDDKTVFATLIGEAELLGVLARGTLSPLGEALLADDHDALLDAAGRLLPAASTTALIGGDLTAVAHGVPSTHLATVLNAYADQESANAATVWRFTPTSIRRALDAGHSARRIQDALAAITTAPLPQPLAYLITDTARTHGRIRLATAATVLHSTEPPLLAEIAAHRTLAKLGLRQIAPTVLISPSPLATTLTALREAGYAPVAENSDGTTRIERLPAQRAKTTRPPRHSRTAADDRSAIPTDLEGLTDLADRLLTAPAAPEPKPASEPVRRSTPGRSVVLEEFTGSTEDVIASYATRLSGSDIRQLAHAVDHDLSITIDYRAATGRHTTRTLSDLDLDPPHLYAWCHLRDDERCFTLARIQGVMPT
ncbi:helicase C-terminal domain-containing protein [Kitasatospora sp. NPDC085895]|uniref:helicase C-terminal domain-containing protein n=1 Tax=Kitasatospora sp. NPDC085895 TaxID=3155057 RepID=UPI00344D00DB